MGSDQKYLYRYYSLNKISELTKIDGLDKKTMRDIIFDNNPNELNSPYFDIYKLNFLLSEKKLWLERCENFNDPLEFFFYIHEDFWYEYLANESFDDKPPSYNKLIPFQLFLLLKCYSVCCFCSCPKNHLMWSYYASGHFGVCIRFKIEEYFQRVIKDEDTESTNVTQYHQGPMLIFKKVKYEESPFILTKDAYTYFQNMLPNYENVFKKINIEASSLDLLTLSEVIARKLKHWEHEKEYRLISFGLDGGIPIDRLTNPSNNKPILQPDAVIFGLKTPDYLQTIIKNSCGNNLLYLYTDIETGTAEIIIKPEF